MANVKVYNMEGKEVGTLELNDAVFGVEVNEHLMHLAVVGQLANKRQGTQSAKTRSEVSGGGRKPWKQKGTGHELCNLKTYTFLRFFSCLLYMILCQLRCVLYRNHNREDKNPGVM